jgi:2-C-methyl-D-erythritol 4-phosphate cytidylyltransferase
LNTQYWLVMPAAGSGTRFGGEIPKQHAPLAGSTVLQASLQLFLADSRCRGIVLAMAAGDEQRAALGATLAAQDSGRVQIVNGGAQRSESVLCGLQALSGRATDDDWVLVHDAVRPCLSRVDLDRLLSAGAASRCGALLAAPMADTVKHADGTLCSEETVPRERLWRALTPQMFRYRQLCTALMQARVAAREPTDEAQALEWLGERPLLVAAVHSNIKITSAEDLAVAAAILASRG